MHEGSAGYYEAIEGGVAHAFPERWAAHLAAGGGFNAAATQRGAVNALVPLESALQNRSAWQRAAERAGRDPSGAMRLRAGGAVLSDDAALAAHACPDDQQRAGEERRLRSARVGSGRAASASPVQAHASVHPRSRIPHDMGVWEPSPHTSGRSRDAALPGKCLSMPRSLAERSRFRSASACRAGHIAAGASSYAQLARARTAAQELHMDSGRTLRHSASCVHDLVRNDPLRGAAPLSKADMALVQRSAPLATVLELSASSALQNGCLSHAPDHGASEAPRSALPAEAGRLQRLEQGAQKCSPRRNAPSAPALRRSETPSRKPWNLSSTFESSASLSRARSSAPHLQSDGFAAADMRAAAAAYMRSQSAHMRRVTGRKAQLQARQH